MSNFDDTIPQCECQNRILNVKIGFSVSVRMSKQDLNVKIGYSVLVRMSTAAKSLFSDRLEGPVFSQNIRKRRRRSESLKSDFRTNCSSGFMLMRWLVVDSRISRIFFFFFFFFFVT